MFWLFLIAEDTDWCHRVTLGHFKKFRLASKMATKNTSVTNLAITMFYNLQNVSFMHIASPINAIEDVMSLWSIWLKPRWHPRWQIQGSLWKCHFFRFASLLAFLKAHTFIFQKMDNLSTHLSLFNILISKDGIKDDYQNTLVTNLAITMFYNLQILHHFCSFHHL